MTVLELLMPLLFSTIIMYLRFNSVPRRRSSTNYSAFDISLMPGFFHHFPVRHNYQLVYIPSKSGALRTIAEMVEQSFDVDFEVLGYSSESSFEDFIIKDPKAFYVLAGIVFRHHFDDRHELLPLAVKYSLRFSHIQRNYVPLKHIFFEDQEGWCTTFLYPPNLSQEPRELLYSDGGSPGEKAHV